MDELLQTNIFFWITSAAVIIITLLLVVVLFYALKIARKVNRFTDKIEKEGTEIVNDVTRLRENIKENAETTWDRVKLFTGLGSPKRSRRKTSDN